MLFSFSIANANSTLNSKGTKFIQEKDLPEEKVSQNISRKYVYGEKGMLVFFKFKKILQFQNILTLRNKLLIFNPER